MISDLQTESALSQPRFRFLIIDGHAYAYRAFYAIRHLNSPTGAPTNAIYGFVKMLAKMRSRIQPTHLVVIWDGGLAAERMEALPAYKAQRPPVPPDLDAQIEDIHTFLRASRIPSLHRDGVEADDWIAALAKQAAATGAEVVIASSDKDFMQLVSERIGILNPNDKSETIWNRDQVVTKTGVTPEQLVDWLSLIGDAVDNIPGIAGVGPKTATDLLRQFGSIDLMLERLAEIKSDKLRQALTEGARLLRRNQTLIRLNETVASDVSFQQCCAQPADGGLLSELYARWGFKGLLRELTEVPAPEEVLL